MKDTKQRIADTLEAMLSERGIAQVTVSDIIERSGVSRQTFYNNFIAIYDLVYWTHCLRIKEAVETFWREGDFCLAFTMAAEVIREHRPFYLQIIRTEGVNSFQRLFARQNVELCKVRIQNVSGKLPDAEEQFLLEFYWYGAAQKLVDWIEKNDTLSPASLARLLHESLPAKLRKYWPAPK